MPTQKSTARQMCIRDRFEVEDVENVEMYHYDGVPASAEKKVVVAENDIKTLYLSLIHI